VSARTRARRSLAGAVLLFLLVFLVVWAALTMWTAMYGNAACMVAALTAWAAVRSRPFARRRR
jgi:dolichol kinase